MHHNLEKLSKFITNILYYKSLFKRLRNYDKKRKFSAFPYVLSGTIGSGFQIKKGSIKYRSLLLLPIPPMASHHSMAKTSFQTIFILPNISTLASTWHKTILFVKFFHCFKMIIPNLKFFFSNLPIC